MAGATKQLSLSDGVTITDPTPVEYMELTEQASAPATPGTGKLRLYYVDDVLYAKDDAGTEYQISFDGNFESELTLKEIATPSNPSSGYRKLYPKNDGKMYTLNSDGEEIEVGSGASSGSGGINYVTNPDAEINVTDGVTASAITVSAETSNPLIGDQSFKLTSTAATGTVDFALDTIDSAFIDAGVLFKIEAFLRVDTGDAGDWKAGLHDGTDYVSGTEQALANGMNIFRQSFIPESGKIYTLRVEHTTTDASDVVVCDNLEVGPGTVIQTTEARARLTDLSVTGMTDATYTKLNHASKPTTITLQPGTYWIEIGATFVTSSSVTPTSIAHVLDLTDSSGTSYASGWKPSGVSSAWNSATSWRGNVSGAGEVVLASAVTLELRGYTDTVGGTITSRDASGGYIFATQVSNSFLGTNNVDYLSSSSTSSSTDTDGTKVKLGAAGSAIPNLSASTGIVRHYINLPTPKQITDQYQILVSTDQVNWSPAGGEAGTTLIPRLGFDGTDTFGIGISTAPSGDTIAVAFGEKRISGTAWPASGFYYLIVRHPPGVPVGFGLAGATSSGLVSTTTQSIAGVKTFNDGIKVDDGANQTTLNYYRQELAQSLTMADGSGGGSSSGKTFVVDITRIGRQIIMTGSWSSGTVSGTLNAQTVTLPSWATPSRTAAMVIFQGSGLTYRMDLTASSTTVTLQRRDSSTNAVSALVSGLSQPINLVYGCEA